MRLKGIIFDGDGVLFDTEKLHVLAWKRFLPFLKEEDFAEGVGVEDNIFLKRLKEKGKIRKQLKIDELVERKNKELLKILEGENLEISDKIKEVLDYLKGKYKLAIASNSEKDFVLKIVKKMGMEKYFDWIFTRNDVKKPKPYPEIYKLALKKMEINPEEAIAFEDSETGINSAKSSGIFCVGVLTTQVIEKLKNADIIINEINLKNIKKIIKIFEQK